MSKQKKENKLETIKRKLNECWKNLSKEQVLFYSIIVTSVFWLSLMTIQTYSLSYQERLDQAEKMMIKSN